MIMRKYPLFIIDTDRSHGRSVETDYMSCTSKEVPFVAEVKVITEEDFNEEYDPANDLCAYSDRRNGLRMRLKVVSIGDKYDSRQLRQLLKRGLKEILVRKQTVTVNTKDVSDEAVVKTMQILLTQVYENLREHPDDTQQKILKGVFNKVIERFNQQRHDD